MSILGLSLGFDPSIWKISLESPIKEFAAILECSIEVDKLQNVVIPLAIFQINICIFLLTAINALIAPAA
ncbi:MAG: hypothetical protein EOP34_11395 [Rickettsiales bacterium]|nr:MAG: hypothetical protein EOP34_11395 [Rickettsiales bacterium]